jgi:alcohol dehydrogenase
MQDILKKSWWFSPPSREGHAMRALQLIEDRKLETVDLPPPPPPGIGEVTVSVKAVALNHIDVWGWRGMAFAKRKMPLVIGAEASGTVDAVGQGVAAWSRDSWSRSTARAPAVCAVPAAKAATISANMSAVCTASISTASPRKRSICRPAISCRHRPASSPGAPLAPVTFGTVEHMLFDNAKLEPGETILIHAGGSGIGTAAIQLAKKMGCTVITTVGSDAKIEPAKALGADHVINYREDRFEGVVRKLTKKKGVDVVFEHVGADTWAGSMLSLKRGGRLVTCGSTSGVSTQMNLMMLFQQQLKLSARSAAGWRTWRTPCRRWLRGIVHPVVDTEVGFDGIDTALARMETGDVFGKIILRMD